MINGQQLTVNNERSYQRTTSPATARHERAGDNGERPFIPYSRQWIDEDDIAAVVEVLRSDWLTTGPKIQEFEEAFAHFVGAKYAVAISNGTAALHCAMYALEIEPGDEVIVPPMTFAATANCIVFQGGTPVFADVDSETLLLDPAQVEANITLRTKALIAVDYAGQPCEYDALREIAQRHGLFLVDDACHALGAEYRGKKVGTLADLTVFSFHPVKHITTGEGGMVTTDDPELANRMKIFRNHGITRNPEMFTVHGSPFADTQHPTDNRQQTTDNGQWYYEMVDLGYNYRIADIQCALGISQLRKLPEFLMRRREIATQYNQDFSNVREIEPVGVREDVLHAYHLYVVKIDFSSLGIDRVRFFEATQAKGIGVNVHYIPVHLHPFFRERFGSQNGKCPVAEYAYEQIISLPIFPAMTNEDISYIARTVCEIVSVY